MPKITKEDAEACIKKLLSYAGDDPQREGLLETPDRVARSYKEMFAGYETKIPMIFKTFDEGAPDEMVLLRHCEFYSTCEHHMAPFFGKAHIAYLPNKRVIGLSKMARLLDAYSRRLQIQERLTTQITEALMEHLQPKGAACILTAKHFCMICRGVNKQHADMVTSSLRGEFLQPEVRAEFLSLINLQ